MTIDLLISVIVDSLEWLIRAFKLIESFSSASLDSILIDNDFKVRSPPRSLDVIAPPYFVTEIPRWNFFATFFSYRTRKPIPTSESSKFKASRTFPLIFLGKQHPLLWHGGGFQWWLYERGNWEGKQMVFRDHAFSWLTNDVSLSYAGGLSFALVYNLTSTRDPRKSVINGYSNHYEGKKKLLVFDMLLQWRCFFSR